MNRVDKLDLELRRFDNELFCEMDAFGRVSVFRKAKRYESFQYNGMNIIYSVPHRHFIFSLTHNWSPDGTPVEWGCIPVINRLKAIDLWNRDLAKDIEVQYEKSKEESSRNHRNSVESFLYDFKSQFAKTFNDVNTSNMNKLDKRSQKWLS